LKFELGLARVGKRRLRKIATNGGYLIDIFDEACALASDERSTSYNEVITPKLGKVALDREFNWLHSFKKIEGFCIKLCHKNSNNLQILVFYRKFAD
jgi:hypothetical protein